MTISMHNGKAQQRPSTLGLEQFRTTFGRGAREIFGELTKKNNDVLKEAEVTIQ